MVRPGGNQAPRPASATHSASVGGSPSTMARPAATISPPMTCSSRQRTMSSGVTAAASEARARSAAARRSTVSAPAEMASARATCSTASHDADRRVLLRDDGRRHDSEADEGRQRGPQAQERGRVQQRQQRHAVGIVDAARGDLEAGQRHRDHGQGDDPPGAGGRHRGHDREGQEGDDQADRCTAVDVARRRERRGPRDERSDREQGDAGPAGERVTEADRSHAPTLKDGDVLSSPPGRPDRGLVDGLEQHVGNRDRVSPI